MRRRDAAAAVTRELTKEEPPLPVDHKLDPAKYLGHATLLHAAARYGRVRCTTALLEHGIEGATGIRDRPGVCLAVRSNSLTELKDAGNFTPLMMAAWCGHLAVVNMLLASGADVDTIGTPPMTSACGGRGPYNAETWAARKGFDEIAASIRAKSALRAFAISAVQAEHEPSEASTSASLDGLERLLLSTMGTNEGAALMRAALKMKCADSDSDDFDEPD